jgi:hypothetical protein
MPKIELHGVTERNVDLLLLAELVLSSDFSDWFVARTGMKEPQTLELECAARSVLASTGESDLELTFYREGCRIRVLVENKIDAVLQPRQAERYLERGQSYISVGDCHQVVTVLIAPKSYLGSASGFERTLTYENLFEWFAASGDPRSMYKDQLLKMAISRRENGWKIVTHTGVTEFWQNYWRLASSVAVGLRMPKPGSKPATSSFIYFKPHQLPKGVKFLHKVPYGNVDLQFDGHAENIGEFTARFENTLDQGMQIARAGKSLVVRMTVDPISLSSCFTNVEASVKAALGDAQHLLRWYELHASILPTSL